MQEIIAAVRDAVKVCRTVQEHYLISNTKTSGDSKEPVTIADYGSQAIICRALQAHYPDDAVVSEESGTQFMELVSDEQRANVIEILSEVLGATVTEDEVVNWLDFGKGKSAQRTWVIDPIDGTKGFIALRHYAIACGLLVDGQIAEGIVAAPGYNEEGALFYTQGGATYRAPLADGTGEQVSISNREASTEFVTVQSVEKAHASKSRMQLTREYAGLEDAIINELDSMEKYALVACGDADLYMRLPREGSTYAHKIWDHVAGVALVKHAGGVVTDVDGSPLDFSQGDTLPNLGMVVSNGTRHDSIVEAVQKVLAE
jgi:3'(2'), 5'-bisphosphate nucleotidase